jgi:hypothetical protein
MGAEARAGVGGERGDAAAEGGGDALEEDLGEALDVGAALAERRAFEGDDGDAVPEVLAEAALADHGGQVAVGGDDEAAVHAERVAAAEARVGAVGEDAEELRLERGRARPSSRKSVRAGLRCGRRGVRRRR